MIIRDNELEVVATPLLMKRVFAEQIVNGTKKVEWREYSPFFERLFLDKKKIERIQKGEDIDPFKDELGFIHFYSTGAPWTLDVFCDDFAMISASKESVNYLKDEWDEVDEEFNNIVKEMDEHNVPDEERPWWFVFHIDRIINRNGI